MTEKKRWNIKGLFIQDDDASEQDAAPAPPARATLVQSSSVVHNVPTASASVVGLTGDTSLFDRQLREAISSHGSEYVKFKAACEELKSVLPDETTRLKSAFVSMKVLGITKEVLVSTAKSCANVMSNEQAEFEDATNLAYTNQVEGGVSKVTTIDKQIEEKLSQISVLQGEVDRMKNEKSRVTAEVDLSRSKIDAARRGFFAAHNKILEEINSDINKISSNL